MSLFIVGSVSRITSNIVHHLAKNSQYKAITIGDLLPSYDYHHRFYRLQRELEESQSKVQLNLTRLSTLNDLQVPKFDDVLFVTHDYYENVTSKTKLMEHTAVANKNRKYLYFATPVEYDHFGYANPESNYSKAEQKVFQINPNSTVIRSDVQDSTEALSALKQAPATWKPRIVSAEEYARIVCEAMAARIQGKRILVRGSQSTQRRTNGDIKETEYKHAKENLGFLVSKYGGYTFNGYEEGKKIEKASS